MIVGHFSDDVFSTLSNSLFFLFNSLTQRAMNVTLAQTICPDVAQKPVTSHFSRKCGWLMVLYTDLFDEKKWKKKFINPTKANDNMKKD